MSDAVDHVVVIGAGVAPAMAALAIARAYSGNGVSVTWLVTAEEKPADHALAASPDIRAFHRLLGISERELVAHAAATLRLGEQFVGWNGDGTAFLHAYGDAGTPFASLPFVQHWTRARAGGLRVPLEEFCLAAIAARQGRVRLTRGEPAVDHGYHLDARGYAALLRRHCETMGVRIIETDDVSAEIDGRHVTGMVTDRGERIAVDLVVDTDGAVIDLVDPDGAVAPPRLCDRAIHASGPPLSPLPLYARTLAHPCGYAVLTPLRSRTDVMFAYDRRHMTDAEARDALPAAAGIRIDRIDAPHAPSRRVRHRPWVGNCVAIGAAAGLPAPIDAAPLLGLQLAVAQLVLTWPIARDQSVEAGIYNDEIGGQRARIDDFRAVHARLNTRPEPFWSAAREQPVSAPLQAKIDLFAARGKFAHGNYEVHVEDSWALCMAGHGLVPRSSDPQVLRVAEQALMVEFQRQLRAVATAVQSMDTHEAALTAIAARTE